MKYMGSKQYMLQNGLKDLLLSEAPKANRFIDLFCGSGAVAKLVAKNVPVKVIGVDLQSYACALTDGVIGRTSKADYDAVQKRWIGKAQKAAKGSSLWKAVNDLNKKKVTTKRKVNLNRKMCALSSRIGPIWSAYGGHYYSAKQAIEIDYLLKYLPSDQQERDLCLAALIATASSCAAAPGHTAQPFQPTAGGSKYIEESWKKDPFEQAQKELAALCEEYAKQKGESFVADALVFADFIEPNDLVFIDPPYSGVQYSRFYHVLETIARGSCGEVSGVGRYPSSEERPRSDFSMTGKAKKSLDDLLKKIAEKEASVIFTFPKEKCSNGLSGSIVRKIASKYFDVDERISKKRRSSTLGGKYPLRSSLRELVFLMHPKTQSRSEGVDVEDESLAGKIPVNHPSLSAR